MNEEILKQYNVEFLLVNDPRGRSEIVVKSDTITLLNSFFIESLSAGLVDEMIEDINSALSNQSYDPEWDMEIATLKIGPINSEFTAIAYLGSNVLPTLDLKEILISYNHWLTSNDYEKYV